MSASLLAAEGGYQEFVHGGGEWLVLWASIAAALSAIAVGALLATQVMAEDSGTEAMRRIATAIQEGASAYLRRQFRTISVIVIPLAIVVFVTSVAIERPDGTEALGFFARGAYRTLAIPSRVRRVSPGGPRCTEAVVPRWVLHRTVLRRCGRLDRAR